MIMITDRIELHSVPLPSPYNKSNNVIVFCPVSVNFQGDLAFADRQQHYDDLICTFLSTPKYLFSVLFSLQTHITLGLTEPARFEIPQHCNSR